VWGIAKTVAERAAEVKRAQASDFSQTPCSNGVVEVGVNVRCQFADLPRSEPTPDLSVGQRLRQAGSIAKFGHYG
jgi:hypothetical protein